MTTKHTPGPWKVGTTTLSSGAVVLKVSAPKGIRNTCIVNVHYTEPHDGIKNLANSSLRESEIPANSIRYKEAEANAMLIAAAPTQHEGHIKISGLAQKALLTANEEAKQRLLQEIFREAEARIKKATE